MPKSMTDPKVRLNSIEYARFLANTVLLSDGTRRSNLTGKTYFIWGRGPKTTFISQVPEFFALLALDGHTPTELAD